MGKFVIKDVNLGGLADSKYQGTKNSVANILGYDLHEEPGLLKANYPMVLDDDKNEADYITDFVKAIVPCSDGNTYFFGSTTGNVWRRESDGTYTIVHNTAPVTGTAGILDAREFNGYIYYSMSHKLGRWPVGSYSGDTWSGENDDFAAFTKNDADFHPMIEQNLRLYIGDGNLLHEIDDTTFRAAPTYGLDIKAPLRIKCLGKLGSDVLIGTYVAANVAKTEIIRWNTWSGSQSSSDPIPEVGINSFLSTDNYVLVSAGENGMIYEYDGTNLTDFKRIPADYSPTDKVTVHPNATCNYLGLPFFALSIISGTPKREDYSINGIYSIGSANKNYPKVLNFELYGSLPFNANIEFGAMASFGNNIFLSWRNNTTGSQGSLEYGVDKIDFTKKISGVVVSRQLSNLRDTGNSFGKVHVSYRNLPPADEMTEGVDRIIVSAKINGGSWKNMAGVIDDINKTFTTSAAVGRVNNVQIKVVTNTTADSTKVADIEQVSVDTD